jgi:hypothetical protein
MSENRTGSEPLEVAAKVDILEALAGKTGIERLRILQGAYEDVTKKLHALSEEIASEMERLGLSKPTGES